MTRLSLEATQSSLPIDIPNGFDASGSSPLALPLVHPLFNSVIYLVKNVDLAG